MIALWLAASIATAPLLKDGDRVVWLGDSITVNHTYTRYVETYVKLRHPEWTMTFVNAGIGGNTAWDALERFDVDVAVHRPTVVFVNFGMNETSYPPEAEQADFAKNMALIFDRLQQIGVRVVVWIDPSPYDATGLSPDGRGAGRAKKLVELVEYVHTEGKKRGLVVVQWHQPLMEAMASWKLAGRADKLIPDKVHPSPQAHAVMAASVLKALGFDVDTPPVQANYRDGALWLGTRKVPWDGNGAVTFDIGDVAKAPLPFIVDVKEAADLGNRDVALLRRLPLQLRGLDKKARYRVAVGEAEVGVFGADELSRGVDLMKTAVPREPQGVPRPDLSTCTTAPGNPFLNDFFCAFDLLYEKDQLRILMRHEKTKHLPDFVPGYLDQFHALQSAWVAAVDADIHAKLRALRARPHTLTIERVALEVPALPKG